MSAYHNVYHVSWYGPLRLDLRPLPDLPLDLGGGAKVSTRQPARINGGSGNLKKKSTLPRTALFDATTLLVQDVCIL